MLSLIRTFFLCFIPLLVAIDVLGILPVFWSMTAEIAAEEKRKLITQASMTALAVSILFLFAGKLLFEFLGINENDFRVAGGIVLLIIAVTDLTFAGQQKRPGPGTHLGVVPIGIPLMMGPAALTTILVIVDNYGYIWASISILANLALIWIVFLKSETVLKLVGEAGSRAAGKVMSLFLAAIAVMMIRVGLSHLMGH